MYEIRFRFKNENSLSEKRCLIVRDPEGISFVRVATKDPRSGEWTDCIGSQLTETYQRSANGTIDSGRLILSAKDPTIIFGSRNTKTQVFHFLFYRNKVSGIYEPWGVSNKDLTRSVSVDDADRYQARLLEQKDLDPSLASLFFSGDEGIYQNIVYENDEVSLLGPNQIPKPGPIFPQRQVKYVTGPVKMNLLIVAATSEPDIGATCAKDTVNFLSAMRRISRVLNIGLNERVIAGDQFKKEIIDAAINDLRPDKNDITIFYYSGHGFTRPELKSPLPLMSLKPVEAPRVGDHFLSMENIYARIKAKGSRLNLVLSDCCNADEFGRPLDQHANVATTRLSFLGLDPGNCRKLFMEDKARTVAITAAQRGELSGGTKDEGGIFTSNFIKSLQTLLSAFYNAADVSWDRIVVEARKRTIQRAQVAKCEQWDGKYKACSQHPVYKAEPSLK